MESLYRRGARRLFDAFRSVRSFNGSPLRRCIPALNVAGYSRTIGMGAAGGGAGAAALAFSGGAAIADTLDSGNTETTLCRVMLPDDANPAGNVHGGSILHLIEQAGWIVATRHANSNKGTGGFSSTGDKELVATVARVEHMDFIEPMYIGEVAQVSANIIYTSKRSMEVRVEVWAENAAKRERRLTNRAVLWYVAVPTDEQTSSGHLVSQPVPSLPPSVKLNKEVAEAAEQRYLAQKAERAKARALPSGSELHALQPLPNARDHSPEASQSSLQHVILPSECFGSKLAQGGVVMKLMDTVAGVTAVRHTHGPAVTAALDAIDFHAPVFNGSLLTVTGKLTHTSRRSMEVEVTVFADNPLTGERKATNTAYFTFVSLNRLTRRVRDVPQLVLETDEDKRRFEEGQARYEERKAARKAGKYNIL